MTATRPERTSRMDRLGNAVEGLLSAPGIDYLMLRVLILTLTGFGVVMVFSTSMTWSLAEGASVFAVALRQTIMVGLGLLAMWVALKVPLTWVKACAPWLFLFTTLLLIAVLIPGIGTGRDEVGSQSWIPLGPVQLQPSELAKVAIAIWGAHHLADRRYSTLEVRNPFIQFIVGAGIWFILIAIQGDLGMALSFAVTVAFILIIAGIPWSFILGGLLISAIGLVSIFSQGGYRTARFTTYFDALFGDFEHVQDEAFQSYQGFLSLADGSLTGVGLGQSRAKWFYLPEAKNDFVFAVVGEELGLWGGALIIILFLLLAFFGMRTALRAANQFHALMAAALVSSVVSQAFINIGYVIGLLPVTGIQLPMISAGGTSAVITLGAMGLLASVARHEPQAVSDMQNRGRPMFDQWLFIGEPTNGGQAVSQPRPKAKNRARAVPVTARPTTSRRTGSVDTLVGQRPTRTGNVARQPQQSRQPQRKAGRRGHPDQYRRR